MVLEPLVRRPRFWLLFIGMPVWALNQAARHADGMQGQLRADEILRGLAEPYWLLLPTLVAFGVGLETASQATSGLERLLVWRGAHRRRLFVWTTACTSAVAAIVWALPMLAAAAYLRVFAPHGESVGGARLPEGFGALPVELWLVAAVMMASVFAATLSSAIGVLTKSGFTAVAVTAALTLTVELGFPVRFDHLKPVTYLRLQPSDPTTPAVLVGYWSTLILGAFVLGWVCLAWRARR